MADDLDLAAPAVGAHGGEPAPMAPAEFEPAPLPITEEDTLGKAARENLATAWARIMPLGGVSMGAPRLKPEELAARAQWVDQTHQALASSSGVAQFNQRRMEALAELEKIGATEYDSFGPSLAMFKGQAADGLAEMFERLKAHPSGLESWKNVGKSASAASMAQRLRAMREGEAVAPSSLKEVVFKSVVGVARLASGVSVARAASLIGDEFKLGWLAVERAGSPEKYLDQQRYEMMSKFGMSSISIEGQGELSFQEQSRMLARGASVLGQAAKRLGIEPKALGMGGWDLRLLNENVNREVLNRHGYMNPSTQVLAIPTAGHDAAHTVVHEWTHMLDRKLGKMLQEQASKPESGLDPFTRDKVMRTSFFSEMPASAQKLMPLAREGLGNVLGAAQGVAAGADGFDELAARREESFDALARRMVFAITEGAQGDAASLAHLNMSQETAQALHGRVQGAVKHLLDSRMLQSSLISAESVMRSPDSALGASAPSTAWMQAWKKVSIDPNASEMSAIEDIAQGLDEHLGTDWRKEPQGNGVAGFGKATEDLREALGLSFADESRELANSKMDGFEKVVQAMGSALDRSPEEYRRLALMNGSMGFALNPESDFAKASKVVESWNGNGYQDSQHEMLARAVGRQDSLMERVDALAKLESLAGGLTLSPGLSALRLAEAPQLSAAAQAQMKKGFSQMTESAGLGPCNMDFGLRGKIEAFLTTEKGKALSGKIEKALTPKPWTPPVGPALAEPSVEPAPAQLGGQGALLGGTANVEPARMASEISVQARTAMGLAGSALATARGGAFVGAAGVAKAGPLVGGAGPLDVALGYFGAFRGVKPAHVESKVGHFEAAASHAKASEIRAVGATGSIAAAMAAGAALGSFAPVVGMGVGAPLAKLDIGAKLAAKRQAEQGVGMEQGVKAGPLRKRGAVAI